MSIQNSKSESRIANLNLLTKQYRTLSYVSGPLIFVERVKDVGFGEMVEVTGADGVTRTGQVLEVNHDRAVVQVFTGTRGLDVDSTRVHFTGAAARLGVSTELLGRRLNGAGEPLDGGPAIVPETFLDINGEPINPYARDHPSEFIQVGISAIDGLNTLVRGQKLPVFSGYGLPANEIAAQMATQATVASLRSSTGPALGATPGAGTREKFVVVFAAIGITQREASFF